MLRPLVLLVAVLAAPGLAEAAGPPPCFGASARAPGHRCADPGASVRPVPDDALLEPSAPCTPARPAAPAVCTFGVPGSVAVARVALVGDSHAEHWRAALAVVAGARRWRGFSVTRGRCPFTMARTRRGRCTGWTASVVRWLRAHRDVHTLIVSANSGSGVVARPGETRAATKIDGYVRAWKAVPASVRRIVVIRDVPHMRTGTHDCITRAVARRRHPGPLCAIPRSEALRRDLQVAAAELFGGRVSVIDLSSFVCDAEKCFPVVGGALVIKDIGHLTRTFSETLGRFLGRDLRRLMVRRPPG